MQPYQQASEEIKRQKDQPGQLIRKGIGAGFGLAAGGATLARVLPFLNQFIPSGIAAKGLAKIDPRLGKVINGAVENGKTMDEAIGFIKEKLQPEQRSIIEQYSPELHQFLTGEIQKGREPLEAGALAETSGKFKKQIAQMVKDHKTPFSSIIEAAYGSAQQPQQQGQQQAQQAPEGPTNNDEALMAALQKILSM